MRIVRQFFFTLFLMGGTIMQEENGHTLPAKIPTGNEDFKEFLQKSIGDQISVGEAIKLLTEIQTRLGRQLKREKFDPWYFVRTDGNLIGIVFVAPSGAVFDICTRLQT